MMKVKNNKRPPLGLTPKEIFILQRVQDIKSAVYRYFEGNKPIPEEWIKEYNDLINSKGILRQNCTVQECTPREAINAFLFKNKKVYVEYRNGKVCFDKEHGGIEYNSPIIGNKYGYFIPEEFLNKKWYMENTSKP